VLARNTSQQHKELIFRAFSYNSVRMESIFLLAIEDFYRALDLNILNIDMSDTSMFFMMSPDRCAESDPGILRWWTR